MEASPSVPNPSVIPKFLEACPAFQATWDRHLALWGDQHRGDFDDTAQLAHFVVDSYAAGEAENLARVFTVIEEFLRTGSADEQGIVVYGLLESVQTISSNRTFGPSVFLPLLGPLSSKAWAEIERAWSGRSSLMDVVRSERP